jgi:hypothetical protein
MINKRKRTEKNKNEKKSSWDSIINNELVWLLSGRRILVGDINKPQHNKYKTNNNCIPYITAQWVGVVVYTITDVLPSAQKKYQLNTCDQFLFSITFHKFNTSHHNGMTTDICVSMFCMISDVCHLKNYLLNMNFIRKVILSLGLLSHSNPSFSGIRIVRKFYWIWVWNVETQHLMHKVRVQL